jgi:5-methylcytosine-specific restriction endonuclease McrA
MGGVSGVVAWGSITLFNTRTQITNEPLTTLKIIMTEKKCSKCKEIKFFAEFSKCKSNKDGYQSFCKGCMKASKLKIRDHISDYQREYYKNNKDKRREYIEANKDRISEYNRKRNDVNRDNKSKNRKIYYQENRDYEIAYSREYQKLNPQKYLAHNAKRRALKKSTSTNDPWELQQIALFYGDCPEDHHVDHIVPLHLGGRHELANLQHLEDRMNLSKHAKHPDDWDDPRPISCRA